MRQDLPYRRYRLYWTSGFTHLGDQHWQLKDYGPVAHDRPPAAEVFDPGRKLTRYIDQPARRVSGPWTSNDESNFLQDVFALSDIFCADQGPYVIKLWPGTDDEQVIEREYERDSAARASDLADVIPQPRWSTYIEVDDNGRVKELPPPALIDVTDWDHIEREVTVHDGIVVHTYPAFGPPSDTIYANLLNPQGVVVGIVYAPIARQQAIWTANHEYNLELLVQLDAGREDATGPLTDVTTIVLDPGTPRERTIQPIRFALE